jgi:aspartyl/asparaginyl beta-hydroxylase (cupin superfamily)
MNVYILNCDMFDNGTHVSHSIVNVFATKELAEKDRDHCIKFEDADNYMFEIAYTITEIQVQGA